MPRCFRREILSPKSAARVYNLHSPVHGFLSGARRFLQHSFQLSYLSDSATLKAFNFSVLWPIFTSLGIAVSHSAVWLLAPLPTFSSSIVWPIYLSQVTLLQIQRALSILSTSIFTSKSIVTDYPSICTRLKHAFCSGFSFMAQYASSHFVVLHGSFSMHFITCIL